MLEKLQKFFSVLLPIINNAGSTLENKIEGIAASYVDLLSVNLDLPLFILSEVRNNPEIFIKIAQKKNFMQESVLVKQLQEKRPDINPLQFLVSVLGMCIFPFIMKPVLHKMTDINENDFHTIFSNIPPYFLYIVNSHYIPLLHLCQTQIHLYYSYQLK